jgi:uncharacterized protein YecE (DUF72 family)
MEFGRVDPDDLSKIDFTLPQDPKATTDVLSKSKDATAKTEVYVGCAKWGRKDWVGKIYPLKTKEADFLNHYARHFNCIELNATFYKIPTEKQTSAWSSKVGDNFIFAPKFAEQITHIKKLKDVDELTKRFLDGVAGFGKNLGPIFFMPHPFMGRKSLDVITDFIESLPHDHDFFIELRNKDWYADQEIQDQIFSVMEANRIGSIITDASGRRDCVHMRLSTPEAFIRFVGNGLHPTDYTRVDAWVQRIKKWMALGIKKIYFFMHQHEEIYSPELAKYVIQQLNKHCETNIVEPKFVDPGTTLFN